MAPKRVFVLAGYIGAPLTLAFQEVIGFPARLAVCPSIQGLLRQIQTRGAHFMQTETPSLPPIQ